MATQRVLIVEPDQQTATWLSRALGTAGFEVSLAFDAATGHAIATSLPPDLAVIDLFLTQTGGVTFADHLWEGQSKPLGIVFTVPRDYVSQSLRERFFGLEDFILKPFHLPELIERLHRLSYRIHNLADVVAELGQHTGRFGNMQAARRMILTLMFADVRGFTGMSESRDPETVAAAANNLLEHLAASVVRFGGIIDKFLGDGMMTVFGIDENSADHELAAAHAAQDIMDNLEDTHTASLFTGIDLKLGIGLHTGAAVVGPVGPPFRRDVTVIGDTVNLASRICSEARPGEILISHDTFQALQNRVDILDIRETFMRGKRFSQRVYSVRLK
ncbi:MAG: hypothetical protein A2289_19375 [Deltaproteobacteria bacterium RIFOXYA12_FULL_58_15]|nr:MAG: hypothetical protein A2289_19375 [Deltaproteobacteria bacterium RIFOXYA12_FULL_58_15]